LQELCEFVIRQGCIDSAFLSTVYAIYVYTKKNEPKGSEYHKAWEILNKVGPLEYDDLFDACDKDLAEAKSENLGIYSMLAPLGSTLRFIMRDIVHGENSLFGVEFLEAKLQSTLAEIRALLKIKV
jgi:hypothetical protein